MSGIRNIGIAGTGALGSIVARALLDGIAGCRLAAISDIAPRTDFGVPCVDFDTLARDCDLIVETLPPAAVPALCKAAFTHGRDIILASSAALLIYPEILENHKRSISRILIPSGALCGLDGVTALKQNGIQSATIASTKKPAGFTGAPYIVENAIDLSAITVRRMIFCGNALEAARAFPANVNVAATLSLAGAGPENTTVEVWADPAAPGNTHEITVQGAFSTIRARVENTPDPSNPKSSMLAGWSIVSLLKKLHEPLVVL